MRFFSFEALREKLAFKVSGARKEDLLSWGVVALGLFFLLIILWDAYLFYGTLAQVRTAEIPIKKIATFSSAEIDEIIELLDERQKKFEEILGK